MTTRIDESPLFNNYISQGDADIFFPTDFGLLERMDHYCSGWLKPDLDKSSKQGKKRRTIMVYVYSLSGFL